METIDFGGGEESPRGVGFPYQSYQRRSFKKPESSKTKEINGFLDKKNASIKQFTEDKEGAIAVTSSINNAFEWCVRHPDWVEKMSDEERFKWIDEVARQFVRYFADSRRDLLGLYDQVKNKRVYAKAASMNDTEVGIEELMPDVDGIIDA